MYWQLNLRLPDPKWFIIAVFIFLLVICWIIMAKAETPSAMEGIASWYSVASCKREGTSGIMANGEVFNDEKFVCASWDFKFGTLLKITNLNNGRWVIVEVCDRGPAKRLYQQGRIIDLSKGAFRKIANLKSGIIPVKIEPIKERR